MKLVSYRSDRGLRAGVLRDGVVIDAWDAIDPGGSQSSVRELLAAGALDELADAGGDGIPIAGVSLDVPVPDPQKIICIGLNYREHAAEAGIEPPPARRSSRSSPMRWFHTQPRSSCPRRARRSTTRQRLRS